MESTQVTDLHLEQPSQLTALLQEIL
jgi:hypothetical protein